MVAQAMEQAVVEARIGLGDAALGGRRERAAGNDHAIVPLVGRRRARDQAARRVNRYGLARIVEPWIEDDHVSPSRMIGNDDGVTDAVVKGQLLPGLPGILREALPHAAAEDGVSAVADFRIGAEQSDSSIGDSEPGPARRAIGEQELAVLVVRAGRASLDVDLVIVVLAGVLIQAAKLQGVASPDP